jgi:hypothetical protein
MKIHQTVQKLLGGNAGSQTHRQAGDFTSLLLFLNEIS